VTAALRSDPRTPYEQPPHGWPRSISRPAAQLPPNSPSCGNQPAHIRVTTRRKTRQLTTPPRPVNRSGTRSHRVPLRHAHLTAVPYISGRHGACAAISTGVVLRAGRLRVAAKDVIGAGDSFVAGYLAARCHGLELEQPLNWGTVCGSCTVGTSGDREGVLRQPELEARAQIAATAR